MFREFRRSSSRTRVVIFLVVLGCFYRVHQILDEPIESSGRVVLSDETMTIVEGGRQNVRWVSVQNSSLSQKLRIFNEVLMTELSSPQNVTRRTSAVDIAKTFEIFHKDKCNSFLFENVFGLDLNGSGDYTYLGKNRLEMMNVVSYILTFSGFGTSLSNGVKSMLKSELQDSSPFYECVDAPSMTRAGGYTKVLNGATAKICHVKCVPDIGEWKGRSTLPEFLVIPDHESVAQTRNCDSQNFSNLPRAPVVIDDIVTSLHVVDQEAIVHRNGAVYLATGQQIVAHSCNPKMALGSKHVFRECDTLLAADDASFCSEIFVLSQQHAMGNYYHSLIEQLPRILPFLSFLRSRPDVCVHVARREGSKLPEVFLKQQFELRNRIVSGHHAANTVYIPQGGGCHQVNYINTHLLTQFTNKYLLRHLQIDNFSHLKPCVILLKRRTRSLLNHDAIETKLRSFCDEHALECIVFDDSNLPTFLETQVMFKRAVLVVGGHGAGLSNIVWCRPGTVIVEVQCKGVARPCFRNLAQKVGLRFYAMMSTLAAESESGHDHHCNRRGLLADEKELDDVLEFVSKHLKNQL